MSVYLPEIDDIYFKKTKDYFQEVISSYSIGNYRSATVMLYSVAICDILFKLQELKDMYNDTVADAILSEVDKSRSEHDNKSKSKWEKEFIDNVYKKTKLLDLEAYTNLNHLYDHRNFSAHPALNENYELVAPSKETTIANIKNILKDILIKPPIFIKNIVDTLSEDLKDKNNLYENAYDELANYLNNKYFSKMPDSMKIATFKAFWKFSFCLPDNSDCLNNMEINRQTLEILIDYFPQEITEYIKGNDQFFYVANDDDCTMNLIVLLSKHPFIYEALNKDTRFQIDTMIDKDSRAKSVAWFKYKSVDEHLQYLKSIKSLSLPSKAIIRMEIYYSEIGEINALIDFFIWYFGESSCFDYANSRFEHAIEPFLNKMSAMQFEQLIKVINENYQIHGRRSAYYSNNIIMKAAKNVLGEEFQYTSYVNFNFDHSILQPNESGDENNSKEIDNDVFKF